MATVVALISVSDKTGIVSFARALTERGVKILSTGGTLKALRSEDVSASSVEEYTESPEVMGGRVKTLHPRIHGGILARLDRDAGDLERIGAQAIDLVVCNLYPFGKTVKNGAQIDEIVENIDIGGPSMVRSAAKNHARVTVVCDPSDYEKVLSELKENDEVTLATRKRLAAKAFAHTAAYDAAISGYLSGAAEGAAGALLTPYLTLPLERVATLRYGENPHQSGAWYRDAGAGAGLLATAREVGHGGKELSFNNLVDLDAALEVVREIQGPGAAVIKHTNPCGLASHPVLAEAYKRARAGDPVSAFGGIVALNRACDLATAEVIAETFIECVVAPSFEPDALARLKKKKKLRVVQTGAWPAARGGLTFKRIGGGFVAQDNDATAAGEVEAAVVATERAPTDDERAGLAFAWLASKHVKSNAIVLAHEQTIVGVGAGQMSRVQSVHIACDKAGDRVTGSVMASDAFFPFPDGIEAAVARGVTAVVQPGGSVKDDVVTAAANEAGIAMLFTGVRHFRH